MMDRYGTIHTAGTALTLALISVLVKITKPWREGRGRLRRIYYLTWVTVGCYMTVFLNILLLVHQLSSTLQARIILALFILLSLIGVLLYFLVAGVIGVVHKEMEDGREHEGTTPPVPDDHRLHLC